jgi:hypothetical protein
MPPDDGAHGPQNWGIFKRHFWGEYGRHSHGESDFCVVGEWTSMEALVAARPKMIALLDSFRDQLEDLEGDLG